ncbi:threonine and homoserine efflux system [Escherichia coli]|uniref:Threonine and homoserine efflux system n=1 Tax=Escherichia coli TaxID=562 RepID=A0A377DJ60_ECOLX|nr:threonine and homoserine efflux system [Escherichia coli]
MPGSLRKMPVWLPIVILLVAMASIQGGASLAKSLFPLVGAPGVTALRLALGTLILIAFFKPWRLRFAKEQRLPLLFYGVSLGGMNYLFYLSIQTVPLGIAVALEFTGPLAVALFSSRRPVDFVWVVLAVSWSVVPATAGARRFPCRFNRLCAGSGGRGLLGYLHFKWATRRSGTWPCDGGNWFVDCSVNFRANWSASGW